MDETRARELLSAEHAEVAGLLANLVQVRDEDRSAERETGDATNPADALAAQGVDDALAQSLTDRLAALERALQRLDDGSFGRSIRSGVPISEERLEADPAAELTVDEAAARP